MTDEQSRILDLLVSGAEIHVDWKARTATVMIDDDKWERINISTFKVLRDKKYLRKKEVPAHHIEDHKEVWR